jgi:D-serine deaminase-like pyridoxal phosphate-dependent protein
MIRAGIDTPAVVVDLDRLAVNIARLQKYLDAYGIANRPHIKTHKIPAIARMQLEAGAVGITCQKIGEAEVMADAGILDIFLPYNIVGDTKMGRLIALARRTTLSVTADSAVVARGLSGAATAAGLTIPVLVEFETGINRCGVQTPLEALDLAKLLAELPGVTFAGLMAYPHNERTDLFLDAVRPLLSAAGLPAPRISLGGTAGMHSAHLRRGVTEYRAGMYIYGDRYTIANGAMTLAECALGVLTTVVSRPTADRGILDAGSKSLSSDLLGQEGYGLIVEYPDASIVTLSEEHGHVDFSKCANRPAVGDRVTVLPNHCCPVSNLANQVYAMRGDNVEMVWKVEARGAVT